MVPARYAGLVKGYSTREVADLLGISEQRVRSFAQAGLVQPVRGERREYRYSFQDIVLLRAARELNKAGISPKRIWTALRSLRSQLPGDRTLATVRIVAIGDEVVVRDAAAAWQPDSGQAVLDFDVATLASEAAPMVRNAAALARDRDDHDADAWFHTAIDLEMIGELNRAISAYQKVLALDWEHTEARINLGRLYHDQGRVPDAERLYREALAKNQDHAVAWFNLGVALEDQARAEQAQECYEKAIQLDPVLADAHYNLSRICERTGQLAMALKHLMRYKALTD